VTPKAPISLVEVGAFGVYTLLRTTVGPLLTEQPEVIAAVA
jgi:hypothetical protein